MAYPQKKKHTSCPLKTDEMYAFYIVSFIVLSSGDYRVVPERILYLSRTDVLIQSLQNLSVPVPMA